MRKIEEVWRGGRLHYVLDGAVVDQRVQTFESHRAPHPGILLDHKPLYGVEWWVDGKMKATIPERDAQVEAVYAAFETGDWSAVPSPQSDRPGIRLDRAEEALRDSPGWKAHVRWVQVERIIGITRRNFDDLARTLDEVEDRVASPSMSPLTVEEMLAIDQRMFNTAASLDSFRDQMVRGDILKAYGASDFRSEILTEVRKVWSEPEMAFLRGLRNALVHKYQVGAGLDVEVGGAGGGCVVIYPGRLLTNGPDVFPQAGKDFAAQHRRLPLRQYMQQTVDRSADLGNWLLNRAKQFHAADLRDAAVLEREVQAAVRQEMERPVKATVQPLGPFTIHLPPPEAPSA